MEQMDEQKTQQKILDLIVLINAAMRNLKLYPPTSALILNSTSKALQAFEEVFAQTDRIELAESEKSLLVCNRLLGEKDQKRPQITAFLDIMLDHGIRSITFEKGLREDELRGLMEILALTAEELEDRGGVHQVINSADLPHIQLDHKIFVAMDKDQHIFSGLGIGDQDVVQYLMGESGGKEIDPDAIREVISSPDFAARTIKAAAERVQSGKGSVPDRERIEQLAKMVDTLQNLTRDLDGATLSKSMAEQMEGVDREVLIPALKQSAQASGGKESLAGRIARVLGPAAASPGNDAGTGPAAGVAGSSGGGEGTPGGKPGPAAAAAGSGSAGGGMSTRIKDAIVEKMVDYLGERLKGGGDPAGAVDQTLSKIDERLSSKGMLESGHVASRAMVSRQMVEWAGGQTELSESFEQISRQLRDMAQTMMMGRHFSQASQIVGLFSKIFQGKTGHSDEVRSLSGNRLKELATDKVFNMLVRDLFSDDKQKQQAAFKNLTLFDKTIVERLLDLLRDSEVMSERLRTLRVLTEIKPPAKSLIRRLQEGGPWYYLRNLILLLGKVGNASHLRELKLFLEHRHISVQRETLNTIFNIGGEERGPMLLAKLPAAEPSLQLKIMSMLGSLRYAPAVNELAAFLTIKAKIPAELKEKLATTACSTMGQIASEEAIPHLQPVIEQKGLFRRRYPHAVRKAALEALTAINHAQAMREKKAPPAATAEKRMPSGPCYAESGRHKGEDHHEWMN
jgi:hypothetical protein